MDNRKQQTITSEFTYIGSISLIYQEKITFGPTQIDSLSPMHQETITPYPANAFSSPSPIHQPIITPRLAQIDSTPLIYQQLITLGAAQISSISPPDWSQEISKAYKNLYIQIPPIKVPNKMLPTIIVAQFVMI